MALNVLVVDDSAVMRAMVIRALRLSRLPLGEVHQAGNGREALTSLQSHWLDLALVDLNMPLMDGEELIDRVRENPATAGVAILVVSTESSEARIQRLLAKGARFVHKPFTPETLRSEVVALTGELVDDAGGTDTLFGGSLDF